MDQEQQQQQVAVEVEEEVLAMAEELPLDTADLANQASRLLEEHDLTNVLNQIPADAFNDLFTGVWWTNSSSCISYCGTSLLIVSVFRHVHKIVKCDY